MRRLALAAIALILPSVAEAAQVYAGCAAPPTTFGHTWVVDPANGHPPPAGDGSAAAPWNSLEAAFQTTAGYAYPLLTTAPYRNANGYVPGPLAGPIQPGDEILLMNGNYGDISIGQYQAGVNNAPAFVTIAAAPGQTPLFTSLSISASSGFAFSGIKVQSLMTREYQPAIINIGDQGSQYQTSNIVLTKMNVSAADPSVTATWTQAQWQSNTRTGFAANGSNNGQNTTCISLTASFVGRNHFDVWLGSNQSLLSDNDLAYFGDDAVDYACSNCGMTMNYVHDVLNFNVGAHPDGFQGYSGQPVAPATYYTFENVLIDHNVIIERTDPNLPFPMWLDGIDDYSYGLGAIDKLTVTNNVVLVSSGTGVLYGNISNSTIANNTVAPLGNPAGYPYIEISSAGIGDSNVRVNNNLTGGLNMQSADPSITADHNIILSGGKGTPIYWIVNGVGTYIGAPGTYGNGNVIDGCGPACEFTVYTPSTFSYNLTQPSQSPAAMAASQPVGAFPIVVQAGALFTPWR